VLASRVRSPGPVSMGLQITTRTESAIYDEILCGIIRKNQNMMARWRRGTGKEKEKVIMFRGRTLSLPRGHALPSISPSDVVKWLDETMEGIQGIKGIHCCANTDWSMVMSTKADILSFDAFDYGHTISLYPDEVRRFLERGGIISWGIVPNSEQTLRETKGRDLADKLDQLFLTLSNKGIDGELIFSQSIITPQCGLGGLSDATSVRAFQLLAETSAELRRRHGRGGG